MKLIFDKNAFTLIEITISVGIFILVFILGANFIVTGLRSSRFGSEQATAIQEARKASEIITKELRGANSSEQGGYALKSINPQNLIFYSDIDDDDEMEQVEYYIQDTYLKKAVTEPGASYDYNTVPATTTIAEYVNNQTEDLFLYYNANNATSTNINDIRLISLSIKINVTPAIAPNDYYVESSVQLRNLKDNL